MSLLKSVSYVPEMILDAPKEIKEAEAVRLIRECAGVCLVKLYRFGCIVTVRGGQGIVMKKRPDGEWSAPVAVTMLGPGLGASIGVQVSDYLMFFKTEALVDAFMDNVGTMGVDGSLAAGTIGREGEALITTAKEGVLTFCSTKGLYGGVSLEFSGVIPDKTANKVQYGDVLASEILNTTPQPTGEIFDKMYAALKDLESVPLEEPAASAPAETVAAQ